MLNHDRVQVSGDALQLASANTLSSFKIDPLGQADGELAVNITCKYLLILINITILSKNRILDHKYNLFIFNSFCSVLSFLLGLFI